MRLSPIACLDRKNKPAAKRKTQETISGEGQWVTAVIDISNIPLINCKSYFSFDYRVDYQKNCESVWQQRSTPAFERNWSMCFAGNKSRTAFQRCEHSSFSDYICPIPLEFWRSQLSFPLRSFSGQAHFTDRVCARSLEGLIKIHCRSFLATLMCCMIMVSTTCMERVPEQETVLQLILQPTS